MSAAHQHADGPTHRDDSGSALEVLLDRHGIDEKLLPWVAELLSHELRTPLTTIYSGSKILSRSAELSQSTVREVSSAIEVEAERLKRVIEDLVVASLPPGRQLTFEPVLLQHVLPGVVRQEHDRWPEIRFVLSVPDHLPPVRADQADVEQVLRNLLSNAARFGPPDGVVTIRVTADQNAVSVGIADQGPGLQAGESERVFDLFYRSPATARHAGLGLGLFVCRRLIEAMNGRIWARSAAGRGAEFGFELPIYPEDGR